MKIAITSDVHGNFDLLYEKIKDVDRIYVCGDFSTFRDMYDFDSTKISKKYRELCKFEFTKYYLGEIKIPIPTYFIGGNHEPNQYLSELKDDRKLIDNLYFLGYHFISKIDNITIAGISGNYSSKYYSYTRNKSLSFIRWRHFLKEDIDFIKNYKDKIDILLTHDWPKGTEKFMTRPARSNLSDELSNLIQEKRPNFTFSGHMHNPVDTNILNTRFISLEILNENTHLKQVIEYKGLELFIY